MLSRGKWLAGIVLFALISEAPTFAATPVKAGSVCSKQGKKTVYQGKSYTCIKSGKKLVWSKGVLVTKPISPPTPVVPVVPGFIAPTNPPKTIADLDPATAWYFAWKSMDEFRRKNASKSTLIDFVLAPNARLDVKDVIAEGLNAGATFWNDFWTPEAPLKVFIGTEKDLDFWKANQKADEYARTVESFSRFGSLNNAAGAGWDSPSYPNMDFYYGSALTAADVRKDSWQTGPHEYTHIVQQTMGHVFGMSGIGSPWIMEGQAEHVGLFLTHQKPEDYVSYRNARLTNQWTWGSTRTLTSPQEIVDAMTYGSPKNDQMSYYSYGMAAWEALVAIHGHQKVLDYFKDVKSGVLWRTAFVTHFGITSEEYLTQVAPYLAKLRMLLVP